MEEIYKERAKQRQIELAGTRPNTLAQNYAKVDKEDNKKVGKVSEIIAKKVGLSPRTYEMAKKIIENGSEEVKEKLRNNKTTISKEYQNIQKDRKRQELLSQLINHNNHDDNIKDNNDNCNLFCNNFTRIDSEIVYDNSIDLVFTDPPYGHNALPLYKDLAIFARRVLKPGGSLVFFVGHIIMDKVINIFNEFSSSVDEDNNNNFETSLKFWWPIAVKHTGNHTKMYPRHVFAEWKPMLWYVKGERGPNELAVSNTMSDYIESMRPAKILHDWEQSTS